MELTKSQLTRLGNIFRSSIWQRQYLNYYWRPTIKHITGRAARQMHLQTRALPPDAIYVGTYQAPVHESAFLDDLTFVLATLTATEVAPTQEDTTMNISQLAALVSNLQSDVEQEIVEASRKTMLLLLDVVGRRAAQDAPEKFAEVEARLRDGTAFTRVTADQQNGGFVLAVTAIDTKTGEPFELLGQFVAQRRQLDG